MFLKKLDINKKELTILAIVTLVFLAALLVFILSLDVGLKDSLTDLEFLGYQFTAGATEVEIATPYDGGFTVEINDDTLHELESLSGDINKAYTRLLSLVRNGMILVYLVFLIVLLWKKKETYFHGIFKGFLIGAALLLLLFTINGIFEVRSLLISFEHHVSHMIFPG